MILVQVIVIENIFSLQTGIRSTSTGGATFKFIGTKNE